jgi:hypothetical protein
VRKLMSLVARTLAALVGLAGAATVVARVVLAHNSPAGRGVRC